MRRRNRRKILPHPEGGLRPARTHAARRRWKAGGPSASLPRHVAALLALSAMPLTMAAPFADWVTLRDQRVVRQAQDFSCGAAALATLLTHYHDYPTTEAELLRSLNPAHALSAQRAWQDFPPVAAAVVRERGVSLNDLIGLARARGLHATAIAAPAAALQALELPVIAYVEPGGEPHFTVLRGIARDGSVQVADPSWGNRLLSAQRFAAMFTPQGAAAGKLLIVSDGKGDRSARQLFGVDRPRPLLLPRPAQRNTSSLR